MKFTREAWQIKLPEGTVIPEGGRAALVMDVKPGAASVVAIVLDAAGAEVARVLCVCRLVDSKTVTRPGED